MSADDELDEGWNPADDWRLALALARRPSATITELAWAVTVMELCEARARDYGRDHLASLWRAKRAEIWPRYEAACEWLMEMSDLVSATPDS